MQLLQATSRLGWKIPLKPSSSPALKVGKDWEWRAAERLLPLTLQLCKGFTHVLHLHILRISTKHEALRCSKSGRAESD